MCGVEWISMAQENEDPILYKARNVTSELLAASKQCCLSTDL